MSNPIVHFEIAGTDAARTREFYSQLFDWELNHVESMDYTMIKAQEGGIGGGLMKAPHGQPYTVFYVLVDDLAASLAKAESLGGKIVVTPTEIPGIGSWAMFSDPDGNMIGIFKS